MVSLNLHSLAEKLNATTTTFIDGRCLYLAVIQQLLQPEGTYITQA